VQWAITLDGLDQHEQAWRALERDCAAPFTVFQTFDWCAEWLRGQQRSNSLAMPTPAIACLYDDARLVLVWPLMRSQTPGGVTLLSQIGEPHTQYGNCLIAPGTSAEQALTHVWESICQLEDVDVVRINAVPAQSAVARHLEDCATALDVANASALMELAAFDNWQAYQATLSKSARRGRAKRFNKLSREGEMTFVALWPGDNGFEQAVRDAIQMKKDWIANTGRISLGLEWDGLADFLFAQPGRPEPLEGMILHALRLDGRNIAIELGLVRNGDYSCFLGGFDWSLRQFSPGKIQIEQSLKWFMEHGVARYDFLPNPADYKESWSSTQQNVCSFVHAMTLKGRVAEAVLGHTMRRRAKTVFYSLPQPVRDATRRILRVR